MAAFTNEPYNWDTRSRSRSPPIQSRPTSRSRSPATSIRINTATPLTHAWYSEVDPRPDPIPNAQEEPLPVLITEENATIGYIWAHPHAQVGEVIQNFADELHIECLIDYDPVQATKWRDLNSLELMGRLVILAEEYLDLRQSRWELFQTVREVPMMARLDYRAPYPQVWHVMALDFHNWVITRRELPSIVRDAVDGIDRLRRRIRATPRGGMKKSQHTQTEDGDMSDIKPQIHSVWTKGVVHDFVVIWVVHAHHEKHCEPYIAMLSATASDLLKKVAQRHAQNIHDMRLTTHKRVIADDEKLVDLARYPLVVHWVTLFDQPEYSSRFDTQWHARDDADVMPTEKRARLPMGLENVISIDMVDGIEEWTLDDPGEVPRAGAKSAKIYRHEPKAAMHTWALQKIEREMPEFSQATASFLLKAEARTVSAALHAKSTAQLQEVMCAAMRRADIQAQKNKDKEQNGDIDDMKRNHEAIIAQMVTMNEVMATKTDLSELYQHIQVQHMMIIQHLQHITHQLQAIEGGKSLHHHSSPCPSTPPLTAIYSQQLPKTTPRATSPSPSLTPTVVASQPASHEEYQTTQDYNAGEQGRDEGGAHDMSRMRMDSDRHDMSPAPSFLQQLEAKSLLAQTQRNKGNALRPFGAAKGM